MFCWWKIHSLAHGTHSAKIGLFPITIVKGTTGKIPLLFSEQKAQVATAFGWESFRLSFLGSYFLHGLIIVRCIFWLHMIYLWNPWSNVCLTNNSSPVSNFLLFISCFAVYLFTFRQRVVSINQEAVLETFVARLMADNVENVEFIGWSLVTLFHCVRIWIIQHENLFSSCSHFFQTIAESGQTRLIVCSLSRIGHALRFNVQW